MVAEVEPGGPADRAGLKPGDLVVRIDQTEIAHAGELARVVARHAPGSRVKVEYVRERGPHTVDVTLDELRDEHIARPDAAPPSGPPPKSTADLGVRVV